MFSFEKLVKLGCAALHVYVMYQNISEWLTADYLIAYKVLPTASHICFHQNSTTLAYILEVIVMHSRYAQIVNLYNQAIYYRFGLWVCLSKTL